MEPLGRFYTSTPISNLLISRLRHQSPKAVLELGVGSGSLLQAAHDRWKDAFFFAVDIDRERIQKVSSDFSFAEFKHIDGLSHSLPEMMNIKVGSIDVAICNPPYLRLKKTNALDRLLEKGGLPGSIRLKRITSDIVFLAQNLQMLKYGGELGIILPDGIFTSREFIPLRKYLLEKHSILGIIQLPDKIFKKTEARTHILILEKGGRTYPHVPLYYSNWSGDLEPVIYISRRDALKRMDYLYYKWKNLRKKAETSMQLKEIGAEIIRGKHTKKELAESGSDYFHTTSFPAGAPVKVQLSNSPTHNAINVETGDILLARVGKRCIGKTVLVGHGSCAVTDCIYRIRVPENFREAVWEAFISKEGQDWLKAHAHGVCSMCLSKEDLLSFPVPVDSPHAY